MLQMQQNFIQVAYTLIVVVTKYTNNRECNMQHDSRNCSNTANGCLFPTLKKKKRVPQKYLYVIG